MAFKFAILFISILFGHVAGDLIAEAINQIILQFHSIRDEKLDIICYECGDFESRDLMEKTVRMQHKNELIAIRAVKGNSSSPFDCLLNSSAVMLFDSLEVYENFSRFVYWKQELASKRPNHVVYVRGLTWKGIEALKLNFGAPNNTHAEHVFLNVNYLVNVNSTTIELITRIAYAEDCFIDFITINHFSKFTQKWHSDNFFPRKSANLHNCSINYFYQNVEPTFYKVRDRLSRKVHLAGCSYNVHEAIAKKLNINAIYYSNADLLSPELSSTIRITAVLDVVHFQKSFAFNQMQLESFVFIESVGFLVPPGQSISQFEKLFMMFDVDAWMAIIATLLGGYSVIFVISLFGSRRIQDLIFGENVRTAYMNLIRAIFGIAQTVLPEKSFARFILMMFIILCLILRTCHQSMLYLLLQLDLRLPVLKTIDEAIEKNFTFYMTMGSGRTFGNAEFVDR